MQNIYTAFNNSNTNETAITKDSRLNDEIESILKHIKSETKLAPIPEQVPEQVETGKKPISGIWQQFVKVAPTGFKHKSLADWSVNPVVGCGHGCTFCYVPSVSVNRQAPKLQALGVTDPDAEWGAYAFIRTWNEEEFRKSARAAENMAVDKLAGDGHRAVMFSTTTDPYQVVKHADSKEGKRLTEELQRIIRRALEIIRDETTLKVRILTRSPLAKKDFSLFKSFGDRLVFGMSLPTLNDKLARVYEPHAPSSTQRLKTLREAKEAGVHVYVAIAPTYPECDEDDIRATLEAVKPLNPVTVYHEPVNMRAENVARIQAQADKEGVALKTEVFATPDAWAKYSLDQLHLVERLAKEVGIYDRLHLWPDPALGTKKFVAAQPNLVAYQQWLDTWWTRISEWPGVNDGKAGRLAPQEPVAPSKTVTSPAVLSKAVTPTVMPSQRVAAAVGLTVRSASEIVKMEFSLADLYMENGVFAKGQRLVMAGAGGLGKSRLLLQLAVSTILGRDFLGMKVRAKGLKWVILQGENSNARLKADLMAIQKSLSPSDWKKVEENLVFHTLETPDDSFLSLKDSQVASELSAMVAKIKPDVIAIDPLASFAVGSLNNDSGMMATCRALDKLAQAAGTQACIVVLHHTLAGRAGLVKATGFDRGAYARGSSTLNAWTRGQINIAPATADDNQRLVITCGKNSNGAEFDPVGIRLNPDSMAYELDETFDLEQWRAEVGAAKPKPKMPTPEFLRELVKAKPMKKKALVDAIKEQTGAAKSTAYIAISAAVEAGTIKPDGDKKCAATA